LQFHNRFEVSFQKEPIKHFISVICFDIVSG
jgi:hypothetical protein